MTKEEAQAIVDNFKYKYKSIDPEELHRQVVTYSFDDNFNLLYSEDCSRDSQKFFVCLLGVDSYNEVAKMALLLPSLPCS